MKLSFERSELEGTLIDRFLRVVTAMPDADAVVGTSQRLSFRQLHESANALAQQICTATLGQHARVAILCSPDSPRVTAMIGVVLAGCAFVMLDPVFSDARCAQLLADSSAGVLVVDLANAARAAALLQQMQPPAPQLIVIGQSASQACSWSAPQVKANDLAAIVYTSGTTGPPKGVMRTHAMMLHRAWLEAGRHESEAGDRHALLSSGAFGSANSESVAGLMNGICMCLYDFANQGMRGLGPWLAHEHITYFHPPVALAREWCLADSSTHILPKLKALRLGGTQIQKRDFQQLKEKLIGPWVPEIGYGASELALICWMYLPDLGAVAGGMLAAGKPVQDKRVLVLNDAQQPIAVGEVGQITICSRYISCGYWGQPELSRKKFFRLKTGEIHYLTGDMGRFDASGQLWVVGRVDDMVKIRGHQVLPSAVEHALCSLDHVSDAVVKVIQDQSGDTALAAYIVTDQQAGFSAQTVRATLATNLPQYMVPRHVLFLDRLPRLPNGKVDRAGLPPPEKQSAMNPAAAIVDTTLAKVQRAWQDVLHQRVEDVHAFFLDVGGDSLAAARLELRLSELFARTIHLPGLIQHPTIASQAGWIDAMSHGETVGSIVVAMNAVISDITVYALPGINGSVDYAHHLARETHTLAVCGVPPMLNPQGGWLASSIGELAAQLAGTISEHAKGQPVALLGPCGGGKLGLEVALHLQKAGVPIGNAFMVDAPGSSGSRQLGPPSVRGALMWTKRALHELASGARIYGAKTALSYLHASAKLVQRRVTEPLGHRGTSLDRARSVEFRRMSAAHQRTAYPFPVCLIKGAWSQVGFRYSGRSESLGWDQHCPQLRIRYVPGTHSGMYQPPMVSALVDVVEQELRHQ